MYPLRILSLPALALLLACAGTTRAAEIYLEDGSIIVGTIELLEDGEDLVVDTKYMDDVVIDWDAIERIEGTADVNVELFSGENVSGTLSLEEGALYVLTEAERRLIAPEQVFEIDQYTARWLDGLSAYVDLGLNLVRGNNQVTQVTYGGGISYDANRFETGIETSLIVNEQTDAEDTRRWTLRSFYNHRIARHWSMGGLYQFESDDQQQLIGRSLLAAKLDNRVLNDRVQRLTLSGGFALNQENFERRNVNESLEGLLGTVYRLRSPWDIDFDATLYVLPSLSQSGRIRVQFDSSLSTDLLGDLDFKLTYYNRYDNQPPVDVGEFDYGVTLALGYDF